MPVHDHRKQILIVDPNLPAIEPVRHRLSELGFSVRSESDGAQAMARFADDPPALVILDWNMPGPAALEVIRRVRSVRSPRPVRLIIVSELASEHDVVTGLESGADDYITKPCSAREVVARVVAVLRSSRMFHEQACVRIDGLEFDAVTNRVSAGGKLLNLRGAEYRLLQFLMSHAGRTFSREQLLSQVWGKDSDVDVRTVDVNVQRLRKILSGPGYEEYLQTVRGFGYRFAVPTPLPAPRPNERLVTPVT
jgi:two-component system phosphate regulon response regulator PhoB